MVVRTVDSGTQEPSQADLQKAAERRLALSCRDILPPEVRHILSCGIGDRLLALAEFRRAASILFYLSFRSEVETHEMVERALELGKEVAVPVVQAKPRALVPCRYTGPQDLAATGLGIMEPRPECALPVDIARLDLVVVPGTAFDHLGGRVGYGLGFYDRLLAQLPQAVRVALAFECQLLPHVMTEPYDQPVDVILTEERVLRTGARRR